MELNPCPFCGCKALVHEVDATGCYDRSIKYNYQPGCETEGCQGEYGGCSYDTVEEAIAAWDHRSHNPLLKEASEVLEWISEDGHAMASMTIGSRNKLMQVITKARHYLNHPSENTPHQPDAHSDE